jgi:Domain of unknown function (DUF5615)
MARLYADEDISRLVVERLRELGQDIVSVTELRRQGRPDEQVLEDAMADSRIVLTHNRSDFARLHPTRPAHAGIVSCSRDPDRMALADRIDRALATAGDLTGVHVRVNRPSIP